MCSFLEMERFWRGERRGTPPNNGIAPRDPVAFFEVLLVFVQGINWNLISFLGVGSISDRGKKKNDCYSHIIGGKKTGFRKNIMKFIHSDFRQVLLFGTVNS